MKAVFHLEHFDWHPIQDRTVFLAIASYVLLLLRLQLAFKPAVFLIALIRASQGLNWPSPIVRDLPLSEADVETGRSLLRVGVIRGAHLVGIPFSFCRSN